MTICGTGTNSISTVDGISGVILPPAQVIVEKLAEQVEFSHLSQTLRERINLITDLQNGLTQVNSTVVNETGILAQELLALRNDLTNAVAYIDQQTSVSIEQRQSMVTSINTMMAQWGNRIAALEETSTVLSQDTGAMLAEKVIKADLNGNVVGYGLSARVDPTGQFSSDFQVRADTFSIAPPSVNSTTAPISPYNGMVWVDTSVTPHVTKWFNKTTGAWGTTPVKGAVPFIVKTTPETLDGITVEPGVYIDSAYISRLRADQIDTRGLSIKDASGNVILAAGNALDWSNVGGTSKPANNATRNQIFRQTAAPTGGTYSIGDLWIDTDAVPTTVSNWDGAQWVVIGNYTSNTNQLTDGAGLGTTAVWSSVTGRPTTLAALDAAAASQLDKKSVTYYQATQPTGMVAADAGDIWFDTGNSYKMYSYSGTSWVLVQDSSAASAAASQAQTTANTKITTFYSTSTPTATAIGDLWYNSTTKLLQRWSGSTWVATANAFDNTNQLTDGAGLGTTAIWASVTGVNKPQDNATVGATFGVNIGGQITSTNVSTYIAAAAIGTAQIANAAITTAQIADANITSAKIADAAITQAKIGNLAVGSAQIADAAITSAKIGDAQVDTFRIGLNAVTIPKSISLSTTVSTGSRASPTEVEVFNFSIDSAGQPVWVHLHGTTTSGGGFAGGSNSGSSYTYWTLTKIYVDGALATSSTDSQLTLTYLIPAGGAGTKTIRVTITNQEDSMHSVFTSGQIYAGATIFAIGVKR